MRERDPKGWVFQQSEEIYHLGPPGSFIDHITHRFLHEGISEQDPKR